MKRSKKEERIARAIKQDLKFYGLVIAFISIMTLGSIIEKML